MGKSTAAMPDIPENWKDNSSDAEAEAGQYYLPGLGPTYLDPEFADKLGDFIQKSKDQGISLQFTSGYRDQAAQDALHDNPTAITPARDSLHSAGRGHQLERLGQGSGQQSIGSCKSRRLELGW